MNTDEEMAVVNDIQVTIPLNGIELYNIAWALDEVHGVQHMGRLAKPDEIAEWVRMMLVKEGLADDVPEPEAEVEEVPKLAGLNDEAIERIASAFKRG
jgi:hypothetical protein